MYKFCFASLTFIFFFAACRTAKPVASKEEWEPLFNRKDLTGWDIKIAGHDLNENFNNNIYVKDSMIVVDYNGYQKFTKEFGHIYYQQPFSYYKIRVEYQFYGKQLTGGPSYAYLNSGVMLHSQSAASVGKEQTFPVSLELQLLGNDSATKVHTCLLYTSPSPR